MHKWLESETVNNDNVKKGEETRPTLLIIYISERCTQQLSMLFVMSANTNRR